MDHREKPGSPGDILEHHGVKGMRWGVRKERAQNLESAAGKVGEITRTTAKGETLTLRPAKVRKFDRAMAAVSKNYADMYANGANLTIHDKDGKNIGDAMFDHKKNGDLYLNWVSIEKSARGRGYASEVMKAAADYGKASGSTRMTLEVPGNAPDARHIYQKMGFTDTGKTMGHKNDLWGGLTEMEYKFD